MLIPVGACALYVGTSVLFAPSRHPLTTTITICRATGQASDPYEAIPLTLAPDGFARLATQFPDAIVPPYSAADFSYPGQNWTEKGQRVWYSGCHDLSSPGP